MGIATTTLVSSSEIEVEVSERPAEEAGPFEKASSLVVGQLIGADDPVESTASQYERAAGEISESQLKTVLLWKAAVARFRDAREREHVDAARTAFDAIRKAADPVMRDWMTLNLAAMFKRTKNYEAAIEVLDEIKDGNTQKAQLIREISEIQRERLENKIRREREAAKEVPPAETAAPKAP